MTEHENNPEQEREILSTITSFLAALSSSSSVSGYLLESEAPFVLSAFSDDSTAADTLPTPKPGTFTLSSTNPPPEIFIEGPIAAVWTAISHTTPNDEQISNYYTPLFLINPPPSSSEWKISMAIRGGFNDGPELPVVGKVKTPEIDRLLTFAEIIFKERNPVALSDWAFPDARFVRNRTGAFLSWAVEKGREAAKQREEGVQWDETMENMEIRTAGGRGVIWFRFAVYIGGKVTGTGIDALLIKREEGGERWLYDGTQSFNEMVEF